MLGGQNGQRGLGVFHIEAVLVPGVVGVEGGGNRTDPGHGEKGGDEPDIVAQDNGCSLAA